MSNDIIQPHKDDLAFQNASAYVQDTCEEFGIYGSIIPYRSSTVPESDRNRDYIIASLSPSLPENFNPEQQLRKQERSKKFFYPHIWVYDLNENSNQLRVNHQMTEYCQKARFLSQLYAAYNTPLPEVLRTSEVNQILDAWEAMHHASANQSLTQKGQKDLDAFFKRENDKGKRDWMQFFRSDRFPDNGGKLAKIKAFNNRHNQVVDKAQLELFNANTKSLTMQEHEYQIFHELMAKQHPEVTYSVGKMEVVDHGLMEMDDAENSPFGRSVSGEEYAVIRKERFANEGWDALAGLNMAYWEFRDVYFRDIDEPIIASVYNKITLEYAKCDSVTDLMTRGPMHLKQIPIDDFMNFVSLAKANKLRFYIDTEGIYSIPSLEYVNVIYNEQQTQLLEAITARMLHDKTSHSYLFDRESLQSRLAGIKHAKSSSSGVPHIPSRD